MEKGNWGGDICQSNFKLQGMEYPVLAKVISQARKAMRPFAATFFDNGSLINRKLAASSGLSASIGEDDTTQPIEMTAIYKIITGAVVKLTDKMTISSCTRVTRNDLIRRKRE